MIISRKLILSCFCFLAFFSCKSVSDKVFGIASDSPSLVNPLSKPAFQKTIDGKKTDLYILRNKYKAKAFFSNYGARILSLTMPDRSGKLRDVVLGFADIEAYQKSTVGATIGRYANRIARGKFKLDGKEYSIFINNPPNALHGGKKGFQDVVWDARQVDSQTLEFSYLSKDMEEGFPGNLQVKVIYKLTDNNELMINYEAVTDKKTIVNLTNHAYFNLNGAGSGTILNHSMQINAEQYTPVDSSLIPLGKMEFLEGSPFDFRKATKIGDRIDNVDLQLKYGKGYDHNYVLNKRIKGVMKVAAIAKGEKSGIVMEVFTQEPGLQFYTGNSRTTFCLETQHFPDSPNQPEFPSTVLNPGEVYRTSTVYKFSVSK